MSLYDVLKVTITLVRGVYVLAVCIRDTKELKNELRDIAGFLVTDLNTVGGLLEQLHKFSHRISVDDGKALVTRLDSLTPIMNEAKNVLEEVSRDRNFFQRLFMKADKYRQQIQNIRQHLIQTYTLIQGSIPGITKISIPCREFPDFRRTFRHVPDKTISIYDFSIIRDTPNSLSTMNFEEFDTTIASCYMKLGNEQFFFSHQLRTWSTFNAKAVVLAKRLKDFQAKWNNRVKSNLSGSNSSLDSISPAHSLPLQPSASPLPLPSGSTNETDGMLEFSEYFMSHDDICGMALTTGFIYIATKYEITVVSLTTQKIIAQYGDEGDVPNTFKQISYLYILSDNENNLYIVDRGQYVVHLYKIGDEGLRFEHVRNYMVIAKVLQDPNLVSCVIFNKNLFISDDANNCLHIFSLNANRQSSYLCDNSMTPFSPGSLCAHGKYLYVANCSAESSSILVFNEEFELVDWFRNNSLEEIFAIDIDPQINELYILTATNSSQNKQKKRPKIVSMNLIIRSQQS